MSKTIEEINAEMAETKRLYEKIEKINKGEKVEDDIEMPEFFSDLLKGMPFGEEKNGNEKRESH